MLVDPAKCARVRQQRLDLRSENPGVIDACVIERLHAKAVAREQQLAPPTIPQCERPHAVESLDRRSAPALISAHQQLGIPASAKVSTQRLKIPPKLQEVVDFSVVAEHVRLIVV